MKNLVLIIFLVPTLHLFGQDFEGQIVYSNSYVSKNSKMSDQQWTTMMGSTQTYLIKGGDYKSVTNGALLQWQLYINKENRLYLKMSNSETALWSDASVQGDEVLKAEVKKSVIDVLGFRCDEVILTCKSGLQKYYFSSKVPVNTNLYVNHKFGNWYDYLVNSNALPLKSIIETAQFIIESTATEIKPMKVNYKEFELPIGIKTEKTSY